MSELPHDHRRAVACFAAIFACNPQAQGVQAAKPMLRPGLELVYAHIPVGEVAGIESFELIYGRQKRRRGGGDDGGPARRSRPLAILQRIAVEALAVCLAYYGHLVAPHQAIRPRRHDVGYEESNSDT